MFAHTNHLPHQLTFNRSIHCIYKIYIEEKNKLSLNNAIKLYVVDYIYLVFFCKKKTILNENVIKWSGKFVYFSLSLMHHFNSHGERTLVWVYLFYPKNKFLYSMALNLCQCYKFSFFPQWNILRPFLYQSLILTLLGH